MLSALPPVLIQAENFDTGGEGVAYHDTTTANLGGAYRTSEGVDIEVTSDAGGGYDIGNMAAGEWLQYTLNAVTAGTYRLDFRFYSSSTGGSFHANIDGVNRTGTMAMPGAPGWGTLSSPTFDLTAGTHVIRVATDSTGGSSSIGWLNWLQLTNVPPTAPSGLTATASSSSAITLNWADNATNETAYSVERKTGSSGTYQVIATLAANSKTYSDSGLAASTQYFYRVCAANGASTSAYSAEVSATTTAATATVPAIPISVTATPTSSSTMTVSWTETSTDATGYTLQRKTGSGGTYQVIATLTTNTPTYSDSGLTASTQYFYRVRALKGTLNSAYSVEASATTLAAVVFTPTWTNTAFTAQTGQLTAEFDATPQMANMDMVMGLSNGSATSFAGMAAIARFNSTGTIDARNGGSYGADASVAYAVGTKYHFKLVVNVTTHTYDVYVSAGTTTTKIATGYAFRTEQASVTQLTSLTSYNTSGGAVIAGLVVTNTTPTVTAPAAPSGLTATASSSSAIALSWADNANNETGYFLERSLDGTTFAQIASLGVNTITYADSGLAAATKYYYRVRASNTAGYSAYSNAANATTQAAVVLAPAAPSGLSATASSSSAIALSWTDNATNETAYLVERSLDGTTFTQTASLAAGTTTYADSGLAASTKYYYRVRASNTAGYSAYSSVANATTQAAAVTGTTLVSPPQATVDAAIAQPLIRFTRSVTNGAFTNDAWDGGASITLAEAAYAGNTTADARLLQQMRYSMTGGNEIVANGGFASQCELWVTSMFAIAKNTPRVWNQLTAAEQAKVDLIMKATLVSSAFVTSDTNPYVASGGQQYGLDGDTNLNRDWNPNYRQGMLGGVLTGVAYFGAAQAQNILSTYNHQTFVSQLQAAGLTNLYQTFNWKAANASSSAPSGAVIQSAVQGYKYYGMAATNAVGIYANVMQFTYSMNVNAGLNGGTGINGAGKIVSGAAGLPNQGALGMILEFDSSDGGGARSSAGYSYDDYRAAMANTFALISAGMWDTNSATIQDIATRVNVGNTDLVYKIQQGYIGYSKGVSEGVFDITQTQWGFTFNLPMWDSVLKPYVNAAPVTVPATPTGLTATATSSSAVTLNWNDNATNETGYQVERKLGSTGTYQVIATLGANAKTYGDTGLAASTQYFYTVCAAIGTVTSADSAEASATTQAVVVVAPTAPTALTATASSSSAIALSWTDNATNETAYSVERKLGSTGTYQVIATLAANSTTYSNSGLTASTQYFYRVRAANGTTMSAYTAEVSATTQAVVVVAPAAPSGLVATSAGSSAITLAWADNANNETAYSVERKLGSTGTYQVIATLAANSTSYSDSGLTASTQYLYRVQAFNGTVTSAYSAEASATTAATSTSVILVPGTGFSGATAQPAAAGTSSQFGYNDKAMARWDTVPYQTVTGQLNIGVVAFHNSGIDRVAFSVNGGAWAAATQMTANPQSGATEYWVTLDASKFSADGKVEVRAIAYPKIGIARVLQGATIADNGENSLYVNVNAHGTLTSQSFYVSKTGSDSNSGTQASPFATIAKAASAFSASADGGTIYLAAGDYIYGTTGSRPVTANRWLTITHAPGVAKSAVRLVGVVGYGLNTQLVRISDITFAPPTWDQQGILASAISDASIWVDNCNLIGPGRTVDSSWGADDLAGIYVTDTSISACRDGISGDIVRNVTITGIGSDAFSGSNLVVNSSVSGTDSTGTVFHADVVQFYSGGPTIENRIYYGLTAQIGGQESGQGVFAGRGQALKDIAFVNCYVTNQLQPNDAIVFSFEDVTTNLYVKNSTFDGKAFWRDDFNFVATDVVVEGSTFTWGLASDISPEPGVLIR